MKPRDKKTLVSLTIALLAIVVVGAVVAGKNARGYPPEVSLMEANATARRDDVVQDPISHQYFNERTLELEMNNSSLFDLMTQKFDQRRWVLYKGPFNQIRATEITTGKRSAVEMTAGPSPDRLPVVHIRIRDSSRPLSGSQVAYYNFRRRLF